MRKIFFTSLKTKISSEYDDINLNMARNCLRTLFKLLSHVLIKSVFEKNISLDDLKTTCVTPAFQVGNKNEVGNYSLISVF